jgi:hypothetical protein
MHKGQEGANVKVPNEFGNDPMKICFEHKTRMKVAHKIKNIIIVENFVLSRRL